MRATALLVLGSRTDRKLVNALLDLGFSPMLRSSMSSALSKLRSERFAAVLVDRGAIDVDALEFVLNVRDINEHVPVVVVGPTDDTDDEEALRAQPGTQVLDRSRERALAELEQALSSEQNQDE